MDVPFTLTPGGFDTQSGSTGWEWDAKYFDATFNSPATFTPLQEGRTEIRYRGADGRRGSVTVDILAAPAEDITTSSRSGTTDTDSTYNPNTGGVPLPSIGSDSSMKENPLTRDSSPPYTLYLFGAAVVLAGVLSIVMCKKG